MNRICDRLLSVLLLTILVVICGICALAQDKSVEMPPDLLHLRRLGCAKLQSSQGIRHTNSNMRPALGRIAQREDV